MFADLGSTPRMTSTTARFADYVRLTFADMRDSLTHSVSTIVAAQSMPPLRREDPPTNLHSGATVKHLISAFDAHAVQAVDTCRAAAQRSRPLEAYLVTALPAEIDTLAEIVSERLIGLNLFDTPARQLLAERRDRALAERRPPVVETKAPILVRVRAWALPRIERIVIGVIITVVGFGVLIWVGWEARPH